MIKFINRIKSSIAKIISMIIAIIKNSVEGSSYIKLDLRAFDVLGDAASMNLSTSAEEGNDLSPTEKTFYCDRLIDLAVGQFFHAQFAQEEDIPEGGGKTIEFRGFEPLGIVTGALTENYTPKGHKLDMKTVCCTVKEFGAWIPLGRWLTMTARDKIITQANKLLGDQAGKSLDTFAREVLCSGTNRLYWDGSVTSKASITKAGENPMYFNTDVVTAARLQLDLQDAPTFEDGYFACITHPVAIADLMKDEGWVEAHKYTDADSIYKGEVGRYDKVRFCSTTNAKVENGEDFTGASRNLTVKTAGTTATIAVNEAISTDEAAAMTGRKILVGGICYDIVSASAGAAGSASVTVNESVTVGTGDILYPGEGGAGGCAIYYHIFLAEGAYGISKISGHSLEFIMNPPGSAGAADPLKQRGSAAWYATWGGCIIIPQYLVVCMTAGSKDLKSN